MPSKKIPIKKKEKVKSYAITALFNTLIAIILTYLVLDKTDFFSVFIVSQCIGLSICGFVTQAVDTGLEFGFAKMMDKLIFGLISGILFGSFLSFLFTHFLHGIGLSYFVKHIFLYAAVFGVLFGIPIIYFFCSWAMIQESENRIHQEKMKRLTMEKESAMMSLRLLQAQIEPHFLFNTLSNVISLFEIDTGKAKKMLIDINEYLRISLQRTRQEMITLDQELELVRRYLDIFKIRMGKRLSFKINNTINMPGMPFPPLVIQPLVENAVKYGIEPKPEGGKITIDCAITDNHATIAVTDTGDGIDQDPDQAGIGINNVSKRLENIYGQKASLELKENKPTGLKALVKVPL